MELFLQMGYGMQESSKTLLSQWGGGNIIVSPVNIGQKPLEKYAKDIHAIGGKLYFDPQIFYPHNPNSNLKEYDYWPQGTLSDDSTLIAIFHYLLELNNKIGAEAIILPSTKFNEESAYKVLKQLSVGANYFRKKTSKQLYATLCVASETIRNQTFLENIIDSIIKLDVDGYYLIIQPANGEYINTDTLWGIGFLKLAWLRLKLHQRQNYLILVQKKLLRNVVNRIHYEQRILSLQ